MIIDRQGVSEGMALFSADRRRVGTVVGCGPANFEVECGFFFRKNYLVPYREVTAVREGEAFVRSTRRELEAAWKRIELVGDEESQVASNNESG